jgi:photosystem II stability/assembly factor-like uncharacterized protein
MKRTLLVILVATTLINCNSPKNAVTTSFSSPDFMEFETLKTKNPITGAVKAGDLVKAYFNHLEKFGKTGNIKLNKNETFPHSWRPVDDYMATLSITRMVYDPKDTKTFYFCTGEGWFNADAARGMGVWKSSDAGVTWSVLPATLNDTFYYCQDMLVHPITGDLYVSTRDGGLQRSQDKGATWKKVLGLGKGAIYNTAADLEITADNEIFVSIGIFNTDGIYFSASGDAGTWEKRMTGLPSAVHRIEMATAPSDANIAYCIPTSSGADRKITGVYRTADKGKNWVEVTSPGDNKELAKVQGWYDLIIKVDPTNSDVVAVGGLNIFRSQDAGQNWLQLAEGDTRVKTNLQYAHVDQHEIHFKNSDTVFFGNDGGIYQCNNFRDAVPVLFDVNKNYNVTQYYSAAMAPEANDQRVLGGTQDNGTYMSTHQGISDFEKLSWADGGFCAVSHKKGNVIFTTTQERRIYRFRGERIDTITNPKVKDANTLFINPLEMDATDPEIIYQASNQGLWRLKNASFADSNGWELASRPFGQISAIASSKNNLNTVIIGRTNGGKVFKIENAHITDNGYFPINMDINNELPTDVYTSCVEVSQKDANHMIVVFSNYGINSIYETRNALSDTVEWTSVEGDLEDMPIRWALIHPDNENVCYIATELGVLYTEKLEGANTKWKPAGNNLPNLRIDMLRYRASDKTFLIATHGRGIFTAKNIAGSYEFNYTERGPRNVGGRTRTIMVDPNDPSGKKVWAGSVSGGLWVTNNIDSAAYSYLPAAEKFSARIFPNPSVNGISRLEIELPRNQEVKVNLYDTKGALVLKLYDGEIKSFSIPINLNGLADEYYIIKIWTEGEEQSFKIVNK